MDNRIFNGETPKPVRMTFMRVVFFVLGGIGLCLAGLIGIATKSVGFFLIMVLVLGAPFFMALMARPRRWYVDKPRDESGKTRYRTYTWLEYALLGTMVLGIVPLLWLLQRLPASITGDIDGGTVIAAAILALAMNAFSWQQKASLNKGAVVGTAVMLVMGALLALDREDMGSAMLLYGYSMVYAGFWGLVRFGFVWTLARREPVVVGRPTPASSAATPTVPPPARKSLYRVLPVTTGIVVVLAAVFVLEVLCNIGHTGGLLSPSLYTLVAFGGLYHPLLLESHQWYRLLAPALLHANLVHLFFNCYALFLIGMLMENFIGRAWFLAVFVLGSVGGSLMSLAIDPPQVISIGASGAIMALFAAALVTSFRRPNPEARNALQKWLILVLVISLLPVINFGGGRIDIAAHLGGAVAGGLLGLIMWAAWDVQRQKPRFTHAAIAVSALGVAGFGYTAVPAMQHYPEYMQEARLHPETSQNPQKAKAERAAFDAAERGYEYETKQDYQQATSWYRKAAEGGNAWAEGALGRMYQYGLGVPVDITAATQWFRKSSDQDDSVGEDGLGYFYGNGIGVKRDYGQARYWFEKSAAHGYASAEYSLGWMYENGTGVPKDPNKALTFYQQAAAQGYVAAAESLGEIYEHGIGLPVDRTAAANWYTQAAKLGSKEAAASLRRRAGSLMRISAFGQKQP